MVTWSCLDDRCIANCGDKCSSKSYHIRGFEAYVFAESAEDAKVFLCVQTSIPFRKDTPEPESIKFFSEETSEETERSLHILENRHLGELPPYIILPKQKWDFGVVSQLPIVQKFLSQQQYDPQA